MRKRRLLPLAALVLAAMAPVAYASSPACQACGAYCGVVFPNDELAFLACYANCYDENGFACMIGPGG